MPVGVQRHDQVAPPCGVARDQIYPWTALYHNGLRKGRHEARDQVLRILQVLQ